MPSDAGAPEVVAHRGASLDAAEHTVEAYELALAQGADRLELDLRLTADGALVVVHDTTLERTAGDPRAVASVTLAELCVIPAAARPLRLGYVLDRFAARTGFLLELKDPNPAMERRLLEELGGAGALGAVTVQSFDLDALRRLRRLNAGLGLAPLYAAAPAPPWRAQWFAEALELAAEGIGLHRKHVDASVVGAARHRGLGVRSWTVNDPREVARHAALGVTGIITDRPAVVRRALPAEAAA